MTEISTAFATAWSLHQDALGTEYLPDSLAKAVADVIPVDGVGISLFSYHLRVPIGASDAAVVLVEQQQATQGSGPCLEAITNDKVTSASHARLLAEWPMLAHAFDQTPYRSTLSMPMNLGEDLQAALDLYFTGHSLPRELDLGDAIVVRNMISEELIRTGVGDGEEETPPMLAGAQATRRRDVWVAMGMLAGARTFTPSDALDTLRGYAFAHDLGLDQLANGLVHGHLDVDDLLGTDHTDGS